MGSPASKLTPTEKELVRQLREGEITVEELVGCLRAIHQFYSEDLW